jgi:hypothetical protein
VNYDLDMDADFDDEINEANSVSGANRAPGANRASLNYNTSKTNDVHDDSDDETHPHLLFADVIIEIMMTMKMMN